MKLKELNLLKNEDRNKPLTGAHLKWIATISMFIDHVAAVFLDSSSLLYWSMRLIGRLAFPLYCFLLVEGFSHTSHKRRYGISLLIFALISEIPFDLALNNSHLEFTSQNVFVTLWIGFITMVFLEKLDQKDPFIRYGTVALFGVLNMLLKADYGFYGILFIGVLYLNRKEVLLRIRLMFILGLYQMTACFSAVFVGLYNGKRGLQPKWFFYLFYPLHLLILGIYVHHR